MKDQTVGMNQVPAESMCPYCRRMLFRLDGLLVEGIAYHNQCYLYIIGKRRDKLRNKLSGKTITLAEAEELKDAEIIYTNIYKDFKKPQTSIKELMDPDDDFSEFDSDTSIEGGTMSCGHKNLLIFKKKLALYEINEAARLTAAKEKKELGSSSQEKVRSIPAPEDENDV